jgi:DNA polymerase III delta prime subunit
MTKSIIKRLKYIEKKQISEIDRDQIEPIVYLNVFWDKANDIEYGFKEYDYFRNGSLKSKAWKLGDYMNIKFIPKDIEVYNNQKVLIIQRVNVVKSETQELIDKTEKANVKLPDIAKNNWGLR